MQDKEDVAAGPDDFALTKASARTFHDLLKTRIATATDEVPSMNQRVRETIAAASLDEKMKHLRLPEAAFLNSFVVPALFAHLRECCGMNDTEARKALLNE